MNIPKDYKQLGGSFTLDHFEFYTLAVYDCSEENDASSRTFRNGLYKDTVSFTYSGSFCVCFGDSGVDEKLEIESFYCSGITCSTMEYDTGKGNIYTFLKAGSTNDLCASIRNKFNNYSGRIGRVNGIDEKQKSELWKKATVDLSKYHEE